MRVMDRGDDVGEGLQISHGPEPLRKPVHLSRANAKPASNRKSKVPTFVIMGSMKHGFERRYGVAQLRNI